jgi:hypothetical protein
MERGRSCIATITRRADVGGWRGMLFLYIVLLLMLFLFYAHISKSMCITACQCGDSDNAHAYFIEGFEAVRHTSATPLCFQIPSSKIGPIASTPKSRKQSPTF